MEGTISILYEVSVIVCLINIFVLERRIEKRLGKVSFVMVGPSACMYVILYIDAPILSVVSFLPLVLLWGIRCQYTYAMQLIDKGKFE